MLLTSYPVFSKGQQAAPEFIKLDWSSYGLQSEFFTAGIKVSLLKCNPAKPPTPLHSPDTQTCRGNEKCAIISVGNCIQPRNCLENTWKVPEKEMASHEGPYGGSIQSSAGLCSNLPSVALQPGATWPFCGSVSLSVHRLWLRTTLGVHPFSAYSMPGTVHTKLNEIGRDSCPCRVYYWGAGGPRGTLGKVISPQ